MNGDREKAWNSLVAPCTGLLGAVAALGLSGASLAGVSCAVALVACGAVGGWIAWRPRRTAPDELLGLIAEFEAFSAAMAPVWSGQIESSRGQMEEAIAQLSARFANIVQQLSRTLDQSARDGAGPGDAEAVYARSQAQLQELVGSLREAMQGKAQMLAKIEDLQRFVGELQDMAEAVARIAQQTNLLAINATIEAAHAGERGRGFAQVAQEVRSLSQMSGDTGRRIIAAINAIHSAINETRAAAQLSQNQEHRVMADSESRISQVLEQFRHLTDHLAQSADLLRHDSRQIQLEVNDSLVQLQFQDRVSQVLSHVRDNIGRMPSVVQNHHALCASEGALRPLDAGPLLQELEATYAMASERAVHRAGAAKTNAPAPAQHEEITFF